MKGNVLMLGGCDSFVQLHYSKLPQLAGNKHNDIESFIFH